MNAAARSLSSGIWFRGNIRQMSVSRVSVLALMLLGLVLISALSVVYVKNVQRIYFNELQTLSQQSGNLEMEWNQLLLEESAVSSPARVQRIAQKNLNMVIPAQERVVLLHSDE